MPLSNATKKTILLGIVGEDDAFTTAAYLALSSTEPFAVGTSNTNITEPNTGSYKRVKIGAQSTSPGIFTRDDATDLSISNSKEIYFPEATASWGAALTHFAIVNSETGALSENSVLAYGTLQSAVTVDSANTVVMFRPGQLVITLDEA